MSTDQAERKEIKNTATNILKQNESRLKEILDNSQGLIENFEFKNMNVEIGKACEHRRKQIKDLTYNTMYMNFGKETIREMMSIRMFCAFDIKGLKEENDLLKDMYHNDTVSINDTYYSFLSLQNGVIKIIKSLEELDSSAKKAKNSK